MMNMLIQKLEGLDRLNDAERQALASIVFRPRTYRVGEVLMREGEVQTESTLLVEGFTARSKTLKNGKRQITSINVTGDFVDLHSFLLKRIDHDIEALTPCTVAKVSHADLGRITEQFPHLTRMLWLSTVIDAAIHRAWMVAMGRLGSLGQIAHLVCEMLIRLQAVGEASADRVLLPFTQAELGDILGLSSVHVNRTIQELRARNVLQWQNQAVTILDAPALRSIAEFDPTYLSLHREPR